MARLWLELNPQVRIVGITGSYGKTNTTVAVAKVLSKKYSTIQTDLNLDTIYNLPITLLKIKPWTEGLVLEMGVDHPGEMDFHLRLVRPEVGILTGITPVHSDEEHLGSIENIIKEKGKLLESLPRDGLAVLNFDDQNVRKMAKKSKAPVLFYGTDKKNCHLWANEIKVNFEGLKFVLNIGKNKYVVKTGLIGKHHIYTCMAGWAVGNYFKIPPEKIFQALQELQPLKGRLNLEEGPANTILLNDAKRANPVSTIAGLETLNELNAKRKIAILGEMGELGDFSEKGHRIVGEKIAKTKIDFLIGVGPLTKFIIEEAVKNGFHSNKCFWAKNVYEAANFLKNNIHEGDLLYLKGSLLRHLERIVMILNGKKVNCFLVSCHNYNQCDSCPNLLKKIK